MAFGIISNKKHTWFMTKHTLKRQLSPLDLEASHMVTLIVLFPNTQAVVPNSIFRTHLEFSKGLSSVLSAIKTILFIQLL